MSAVENPIVRVVVVDDQAIVRDGLATVLDLLDDVEVVGQAEDGEQAVRVVAETEPDVVLMDLRMPGVDGVEATRRILERHPGIAVLVLTTYSDDASIAGALKAGARGYLTKDAGRVELAAAVRAVASGQTTLSAAVGAKLIGGLDPDPDSDPASPGALLRRFPALTRREAEVLGHVAAGRSNPEIAAELFLSTATVKSHVNQIFAKLGVTTRAQAIALVRR